MSDFTLSTPDAGSDPGSLPRNVLMAAFAAAVVASIALGFFSWGRKVVYPFALLGTWAHEMGHGIGALITGNRFEELELYRSLGGQALIGGADGISQVIVSSLGLIGPALLGALVMVLGSRARTAPYVLAGLAVVIVASALIWIRNSFGFFAMIAIAAALGLVAKFAPELIRIVTAQLVAVQLALSAWSTRDYLFISGFERGGWQDSDTQNIADELFLPYWFWGGLLGGLSILVLLWAFWYAWIRPFASQDPT